MAMEQNKSGKLESVQFIQTAEQDRTDNAGVVSTKRLKKLLSEFAEMPQERPRLDDNDYLWRRNAELDKQREQIRRRIP